MVQPCLPSCAVQTGNAMVGRDTAKEKRRTVTATLHCAVIGPPSHVSTRDADCRTAAASSSMSTHTCTGVGHHHVTSLDVRDTDCSSVSLAFTLHYRLYRTSVWLIRI
eukprot:scpid35468/ scgid17747/ 